MRVSTNSDARDAWEVIASDLPALAFELAPDGRVLFVNDRWFARMGIARDHLLADAWRAIVHPEDLARAAARLHASLASGEEYQDEVRLRVGDGSYRLFRSNAGPSRDAAGTIVSWYGIAIDIEDREIVRRSLATTEGALSTLLGALPLMVWTADATGWIDWYNDRWFEYTGQTPAEAAGWGWQNAHHPDDFPRVMEAWPRSIETGAPFEMEFRLRGADGAFRWFLTRIVPVRDHGGNIVRWYGSNTDIEEQKRSEERSAEVGTLGQALALDRLPTHDRLRFDGIYRTAERESLVGGDWYDATELPDGRFVISCGDVEGHGVAASLNVCRLRQSILIAALDGYDPGEILRRVNAVLRSQETTIATCVVAVLDPRDFSLAYALAGHPPPVIALAPAQAKALPYADAPPLGVIDAFATTTQRVVLGSDAVVVFYSDGLTEFARDIEPAELRLLAAAGALVGDRANLCPATSIQEAVMRGATSSDDVAILVVQCTSAQIAFPGDDRASLVKRWRFHSSDARTAQASRRELMTFLASGAGEGSDLYGAELVLGEILANTVEHAPGLVEITIDWTGSFPELAVRDRGPGIVRRSEPATAPLDPLSEDGRGLFLMTALARELRIERPEDGGTRVVAVLPIARAARASERSRVARA